MKKNAIPLKASPWRYLITALLLAVMALGALPVQRAQAAEIPPTSGEAQSAAPKSLSTATRPAVKAKAGGLRNGIMAFLRIDGNPLQIDAENNGQIGLYKDGVPQYFSGTSWGTMLFLNGTSLGYDWGWFLPNAFTPVSHTMPDPWTIVTVYDAGSNARVTQTIEYVNGDQSYKITWQIENISAAPLTDIRLIHGGDTFFGGDDSASGFWNPSLGMVYLTNPNPLIDGIMGFLGDTASPADHYYEGFYGDNYTYMASGRLPDSVDASYLDAGYSLEWDRLTLDPGQTWEVVAYQKFTPPGMVQVYAPTGQESFDAFTVFSYDFVVQNLGLITDTFDLQAVSSAGWGVSITSSSPITLTPGASTVVTVQLSPGGAYGSDDLTLTATSQSDPTVTNLDSVRSAVNLAPPVAVDDSGAGFITDEATPFTLDDVLANDSDPNGDPLSLLSYDDSALLGSLALTAGSAGGLDLTFDTDGRVTTNFSGVYNAANAVAVQADGKIVVAGYTANASFISDFALARYNTDGSLDASFGTGGLVTTDFFGNSNAAYAAAVQADGKIVVAGYANNGSDYDFALARYNADGSLDASFGAGGLVTTDFFGNNDIASAVAVQADGKIVAAGYDSNDFALARYNTDGSLDASFGTGGLVTTDFFGYPDYAYAVAVQADGKIIADGSTWTGSDRDFALARYNTDGSLDASFGAGGLVTTDFFGYPDYAYAVAVQADGKIVAAGNANNGSNADFSLARYNNDGSLDASFGTGGLVTTDFFGDDDGVDAVAVQADGQIVTAGYAYDASGISNDFALARYNADGSLDASFGAGGLVTTDFFGNYDGANAVAVQADGQIVAAGYAYDASGISHDFALARYNGDGGFTYDPDGQFEWLAAGESFFDIFTYVVTDGVLTDTATVTITVNGLNDAPVAMDDGYATDEDTPLTLAAPGVLDNDSDVDLSDTLSVLSYDDSGLLGSLALAADGSFTYDPDGQFDWLAVGDSFFDIFTYVATDGILTDTATVTVTVSGLNDAPVADDQAIMTDEDTPYSGTLTASDVDSALLDFGLDTAPAHGVVSIALDGSFTYTPTLDYNGADVFTFTVTDGSLSDLGRVDITVNPVNDAPVADDQAIMTDEGTPYSGMLTASDVDSALLDFGLDTAPAHGVVSIALDGSFTYTPTLDYNGADVFTFTVTDGSLSDLGRVDITVNPVNDAPVADDQAIMTDEDTPYSGTLTASDVDSALLDFGLDTAPAHGVVSIALDGSFTYTPTLDYNGADVFTFTVTDGSLSDLGRVDITVNPVNDAPVADDQAITTDEDTPYSGMLTASDVDADLLDFGLDTAPAHGVVSIALDGSFTYTPTLDYNGADVFTFTVTDGSLSDLGRVDITVNPVNDAPVADDQAITTDEDTPYSGTLTASDVDSALLDFGLDTAPAHGVVSIALDGSFTYTPTLDYNGADVFTFTVTDGSLSDLGRVDITVNPVNDAPVADDQAITTDEDTPYSGMLTASDVDSALLDFGLDTAPAHGVVSIALDGSFTYTPTLDYNGADVFTFTVTDGSLSDLGRVDITVNPVNDAPVADDQAIMTDEDTPYSGMLTASDVDADLLDFGLDTAPAHGVVSIALDGSFTYTPTLDYNGADVFTFTVTDGSLSDLGRVDITVNPVNDAPVADDQAIMTDEDMPYSGMLTASDVDADPLDFGLDTAPAHGVVSIALDGSFTYTPTLDYNGADVFTFTVTDGSLSDLGRVDITVNPVNDVPVVDAGADQTSSEGQLTQFSGSYSDPGLRGIQAVTITWDFGDGATLTGTLTPVHTYADDGVYTVTLTVDDGEGGVASDTLLATIENVAPELAPIADQSVALGTVLTLTAVYTDPGVLDTQVAVIDWGDGFTETLNLGAGLNGFDFAHAFDTVGIYTVTITLTDDDGGVDEVSFLVTVVKIEHYFYMPFILMNGPYGGDR